MQNTVKEKVLILLLEFYLCKNKKDAILWYKNSRLEACANKTAEKLVDTGQGELVISHIKRVGSGSYV